MLMTLLLLLTVYNASPSLLEDECDVLYGQGCICNMSQVLLDIESILQAPVNIHFVNDLMSEVSVRIAQYQCKAYEPLPRGFDVTLQTTPSRVGGLMNDSGTQSMSSEEFEKGIYEYTLVENANIVYVFPGSDQRFTCIVGSRDFLKDVGTVHYEWNYNRKTNLSTLEERITIHRRSGDLTISDVDPNDKGSYYCMLSYNEDNTGETVEQEYKHDLEVITIPQYSILSTVHYHTRNTDCKEEILELIELYMPSLLHDVLCRLDRGDVTHGKVCKVTAGNPVCRTVENLKQVSISVHVDLIQRSLEFPSLRSTSNNCNPICQQKIHAKLMSILERNTRKALKLPILANATFIMSDLLPNQNKLKTKILTSCKAGYFVLDSYCAPCPPNHFSLDGSSSCLKCKLGYYQPKYGSKNCKPSFKGIQNIKLINVSSEWNWKSFIIVIIVFITLIIVCCFIQQVMILFMPLRIAFKCLGIVFSLCTTAVKLLWTIITKSIGIFIATLLACCRVFYWRRGNRETKNTENSKGNKVKFETAEEETVSLLPENRDKKIVKFDKQSRYMKKRKGLNNVKMKAKKINTKTKFQKLAGYMKRTDKKATLPNPENRESSSTSRFSDYSSQSQSSAPPHGPQKSQDINKSNTSTLFNKSNTSPNQPLVSYHTTMAGPQKTFLKDVLLLSENEDDFSQEETMHERGARPDGLDFVHLHTKLRKSNNH